MPAVNNEVRIPQEAATISTYPPGEPAPNPMFVGKRVYQGRSGLSDPPLAIEKIHDERGDRIHPGLLEAFESGDIEVQTHDTPSTPVTHS